MLEGVKLGDSIAVNGVCLTVTEFDEKTFTVGLSPETLRLTNLADLEANTPRGRVNLER
jgi:riboflavin synthase